MKKTLLIFLVMFISTVTFADDITEGYYRIINIGLDVLGNNKSVKETTYCRVADSYINISKNSGTNQEFEALQLWSGLDDAIASPGTVIYAKKSNAASGWDLLAQGISVQQKLNGYNWKVSGNADKCILSASAMGQTLYLWATIKKAGGHYHVTSSQTVEGTGSTLKSDAYKQWKLIKINNDDNYVAVKPRFTVTKDGVTKYYAPYYASFPFRILSSGMKVYYVSELTANNYTLKQINSDIIPGATPVIIECSSNVLADNKIEPLYGVSAPTITDNKLSGCYFRNGYAPTTSTERLTTFDPQKMRAWNVKDGSLVLSNNTDDYKMTSPTTGFFLMANESYATNLPSGVSDVLYEGVSVPEVKAISVNPTTVEQKVNKQTTATVTVEDASAASGKTVTATSSDPTVATVTGNGTVDANGQTQFVINSVNAGTATITYTITGTDGSVLTATTEVTVVGPEISSLTADPSTISAPSSTLKTVTVTASPADEAEGSTITAVSDNDAVATVSPASAIVGKDGTAQFTINTVGSGNATITYSIDSTPWTISTTTQVTVTKPQVETITVDPAALTIEYGGNKTITVTALPVIASKGLAVMVSSSAPDVAKSKQDGVTLDDNGHATFTIDALKPGTSTLEFSINGTDLKTTAQVTVPMPDITSFAVSDPTATIEKNSSKTVTLTAKPAIAVSGKKVIITSSDSKIVSTEAEVTLDNNGEASVVLSGVNSGTATITYKLDGTDFSATTAVTVPVFQNDTMMINKSLMEVPYKEKATVSLSALPIAKFATQNVTAKVSVDGIVSLNKTSFPLSNNADATVEIEGLAKGTTVITFSIDGTNLYVCDTVTVTLPAISSFTVSDATATIEKNSSKSVTLSALPVISANGTKVSVTSSDNTVVSVDPANVTLDAEGKATVVLTALKTGTATVTYKLEGTDKTATTVVTVPVFQEDTMMINKSRMELIYKEKATVTLSALPIEKFAAKNITAKVSVDGVVTLAKTSFPLSNNADATVEIEGKGFGTTVITFSIDGTDLFVCDTVTVPLITVETPTADLEEGSYLYNGRTVTLSCNPTDNATIYYTLDGSNPQTSSSRVAYSTPITLSNDVTLKAIAENAKGIQSGILERHYYLMRSTDGIVLNSGWNWISFNMENAALSSYDTFVAKGKWGEGDELKEKNLFYDYSTTYNKWYGTINSSSKIKNGHIYGMVKVHSATSQTLDITGIAINPDDCAISVGEGWNFIEYVPLSELSVEDALQGYKAKVNDVIKSQSASAIYTGSGWTGNLSNLQPGQGYMLMHTDSANTTSFRYPVVYPAVNASPAKAANFDDPNDDATHLFSGNMNIVAELTGDDVQEGDVIVATANGEVRGTTTVNAEKKVLMTIEGDGATDVTLTLQRDGETISSAKETFTFQDNAIVGSWTNPTSVEFVTAEEDSDASVSTTTGEVYGIDGKAYGTSDVKSLNKGAYIIKTETSTSKVIKR